MEVEINRSIYFQKFKNIRKNPFFWDMILKNKRFVLLEVTEK